MRREEIAALAARAEPGGTVWSRFNLSESLPEPTPMTWAIVRRFMSGHGGFGLMYRDLGFEPDPAVDDEGVYDLVGGRPTATSAASRASRRLAALRTSLRRAQGRSAKALYPQAAAELAPAAGFWLLLPLRLPFIVADSVAPA